MSVSLSWSDLEFDHPLGEGQAGVVHLAKLRNPYRELSAGTRVAVKEYKRWVLEERGQLERIIRELEIGRSVTHENLVRTLSVILTSDNRIALVMRYYPGETLEQVLVRARERSHPIDLDYAFKILRGLAGAVEALHLAEAIHRDIKPANVMVLDGNPVLMDLGVVSSKDFPEQTETSAFLGTIRYADPNYLFGERPTKAGDIYSLGAIAYELFLGRRFIGEVDQWARIVLQKEKEFSIDPSELERLHGLATAEYLYHLIQKTLGGVGERFSIREFVHAISRPFWKFPFYIEDGRVQEGEPTTTLPEELAGSKLVTSLGEAAEYLKRRVPRESLEYLRNLIANSYWDSDVDGVSIAEACYKDPVKSLIDAGALINCGGVSGLPAGCDVPEWVQKLYRYGYLESEGSTVGGG